MPLIGKTNITRKLRPDTLGRMGFGKYMYYRFDDVPLGYLGWVWNTILDLSKYPNLIKYIKKNMENIINAEQRTYYDC